MKTDEAIKLLNEHKYIGVVVPNTLYIYGVLAIVMYNGEPLPIAPIFSDGCVHEETVKFAIECYRSIDDRLPKRV